MNKDDVLKQQNDHMKSGNVSAVKYTEVTESTFFIMYSYTYGSSENFHIKTTIDNNIMSGFRVTLERNLVQENIYKTNTNH